MRDAMDVEVPIRAALVVADLPAHAFREISAPPPGRESGRLDQLAQHLLVRHLVEIAKNAISTAVKHFR
jgi:hypothetical protein